MSRSGVSDRVLGLEARWFTGEEWRNGVAVEESRREFEEKYQAWKKATPPMNRKARRQARFVKWFRNDLLRSDME